MSFSVDVKGELGALQELARDLEAAGRGAHDVDIARASARDASAAARAAYDGPVATGAMRDAVTTYEARGDALALDQGGIERYMRVQATRHDLSATQRAAADAIGPHAEAVLAEELSP